MECPSTKQNKQNGNKTKPFSLDCLIEVMEFGLYRHLWLVIQKTGSRENASIFLENAERTTDQVLVETRAVEAVRVRP